MYIALLVETLASRTFAFLNHVQSAEYATHLINGLRMKPPAVVFDI